MTPPPFTDPRAGSDARAGPRVLGIDPGSRHTGWALVLRSNGRFQLEEAGVIDTDPAAPMALRLCQILRELRGIIRLQQPTVAAIEVIFSHRSAVSALTLGQARGVALAALADSDLAVHEYHASTIKQSVGGSGKADKAQVARMVGMLLGGSVATTSADALDACAIAMTHHLHAGRVAATGQISAAPKGTRTRKLDPRLPASWGIKLPAVGFAKPGSQR